MVFGVRAIFKQLELYITVGHNNIRSIINLWSGESKEKAEPISSL